MKYPKETEYIGRMPVAPLVGAWIEIQNVLDEQVVNDVAPLVGAWIEIWWHLVLVCTHSVAPLVGAWIEIISEELSNNKVVSLLL